MNEILDRLQQVQIEILDIIDKICKDNGLHYSLYAGTLLGAVRHKGFIPWDDDLDVCMPRRDYEKFIILWDKLQIRDYVLQNKDNTPSFSQSFSKIRKNNTCFLQMEEERGKYHTGIFVDIFPVDRIPDGKIQRILYTWSCMKYQLFTREFEPPKGNAIVKIGSYILLKITPPNRREKNRKKLEKKITSYDSRQNLQVIFIESMSTIIKPMPSALLDEYIYLQFGERQYMCFKLWHEFLSERYGDYMQLPPEDERKWKHHPMILNFEHNFEELK